MYLHRIATVIGAGAATLALGLGLSGQPASAWSARTTWSQSARPYGGHDTHFSRDNYDRDQRDNYDSSRWRRADQSRRDQENRRWRDQSRRDRYDWEAQRGRAHTAHFRHNQNNQYRHDRNNRR